MKYLLKWFLLSLAFVPLLVNVETLFPFIFTKTLLIRSAVTLFWIAFAVWYFRERSVVTKLLHERWRFFKNPVYVATSIYVLLMLFSTIFAVDSFKAFFGDIERGEGYLGMLHFFGFFVASLVVFDREDWVTFFRLNLITGAILLVDSVGEIVSGEFIRAQSFTGNPTFLAGYFLFVIFAAVIAFLSTPQKRFLWRSFAFLMLLGGIVGLFLTGTRGAILGFVAGVVLAVFYFALKGGGVKLKLPGGFAPDLQKASIAALAFLVLAMGAFVATRDNALWQGIPGVDRFATLSLSDSTLQTRLISAGVSIDAVSPTENDAGRFLIGYGPDNFNIAYNKHYNPEYMRYESLWFDRAHNKVFDVLVMTGVLGLLAYGAMWFLLFYLAFRRIEEKGYAAAILFFGTAFFVQNLFVFDQISTIIPFFALFAFGVFAGSSTAAAASDGVWFARFRTVTGKALPFKLPFVALFFAFALVAYMFVPYAQSVRFIRAIQTGNAQVVSNSLDSFTEPYTYAQATVRNRLLTMVFPLAGNPEIRGLVDRVVVLQEEFVERQPYDPRDFSLLANAYRIQGNLGEPGAYDKAIEYELAALELSPKRQDHLFGLASLYADKGDFVKMNEYANELIASAPDVPRNKVLYGMVITREGSARYAEAREVIQSATTDPQMYFLGEQEIGVLRTAHSLYLDYFSNQRDAEHFVKALEGARDLESRFEAIELVRYEAGAIDAPPPNRSAEFQARIDAFEAEGWESLATGR